MTSARDGGRAHERTGSRGASHRPSPVFLGLVGVTAASGAAVWFGLEPAGLVAFVFVMSAWLVSLCLHEFAHALVAYRNGDASVAYRGYLTLDPLRYTHVMFSLVLPMLFVLLGGIGLPGGAVFIDRGALRSKWAASAVSAAGPATNLGLAILLSIALGLRGETVSAFWVAIAFVLFLQVTAAVLNLLPIPGLDGWGILEPHLPRAWSRRVVRFAPFAIIGLFALLWVPQIGRVFFGFVYGIVALLGVPPMFVSFGYDLFQFWR